MTKKILVTGADGFIGSHLTEALVRQGYDVRAFVFYNSFNSWGWLDHSAADVQGHFEVVAGDVRDAGGVREAVRGCEAVLHLAALIGIPYSYVAPEAYVDTNIKGTLNVLSAAREVGAKVVHTSTSEVYGTARFVPITEEHPLQAQSPYSATKIGADNIALSFQRSFGMPVMVLRPFNTYGPRQSARAVIPTIITQIATGERRIRLGALSPTRDFNYVSDTVAGFIAALRSGEAALGDVVNVGSGHEISVGDTARLIAEIMGCDIEIVSDEQRVRPEHSEVERLLAANDKARRLLDWSPQYAGRSGLRRGLTETVEWFTNPAHLGKYKANRYNV